VSLEGTLETIALPDVLALLSVTAKTGELRIEAGGGVGSVWFDDGQLAGFDVGNHGTPVDALFALLRLREGGFKFHTGTEVANPVPLQDVAPVLEEAENRLEEWPDIAAVVPSPFSQLTLEDSVEGNVMLRPDQWQLVASVGGGRLVLEVISDRHLGEFDGCKAIKELVDLHLVHVAVVDEPAADDAFAGPVPSLELSADLTADLSAEYDEGTDYAGEAGDWDNQEADQFTDEDTDGPAGVEGLDNFGSHYFAHDPEAGPAGADNGEAGTFEVGPLPAGNVEVADVADFADFSDISEVWNDEIGKAEPLSVTADVPVPAEPEPVEPRPEPVNRGLLLKFLGSARN
jgi:hypothetical protein